MNATLRAALVAAGLAAAAAPAWCQSVRIAYIEGMSGPQGSVGELGGRNLQFVIDDMNAKGGVLGGRKLEMVTFDSKMSPQEALVNLKSAIDQGIQYVAQGNGSSVAGGLIDAIQKHNDRNPDKRVLFLNFAAIDPDFTNGKCNFWHFRFDAHSDMKMHAITDAIKADPRVKKVYLINQDYAHGHQVNKAAKELLPRKRPDVQVVGEELHPLARVKDFSPYVAKIRASGADTVITGSWGTDLTLLVKAAKDSGLDLEWYTYYAGAYGSAQAIGEGGIGKVKVVVEWNNNVDNAKTEAFYAAYKKKYPEGKDEFYYYRMKNMVGMLAKAIDQAKTTDPFKVALALENMTYASEIGDVTMRGDDHQLLQPLYVLTMAKAGSKGVRHEVEASGFGFVPSAPIPAKDTALPTTCRMARPAN